MSVLLALANDAAVGVFGCVLSAAFCGALGSRRNRWLLAGVTAAILGVQGAVYLWCNSLLLRELYPLITHLPLWITLCAITGKRLWPLICVLTAYLCCQLRRWLALLIVAVLGGDAAMQAAAELAATLPLLLLLLRFVAPAVCSLGDHPTAVQCQFGLIPALGYGFDYLTRIYTDLLYKGVPAAVEFMPFVCCLSYLIFLLRGAEDERVRVQLEQTQNSLNLQVTQAAREVALLRSAQQRASFYRHDLRHHLQYISTCIENRQPEEAQAYIRGICAEIEAHRVQIYCENETVNLILSAFAGRAAAEGLALEAHIALSAQLPIADSDLCVLLSNALENALRACKALPERGAEYCIEVAAHEKAGKLFLQIVNPCEGEIVFENGLPITREPGHGIGVQSICAIVRQYGGIYDFSASNGRFVLRLSL